MEFGERFGGKRLGALQDTADSVIARRQFSFLIVGERQDPKCEDLVDFSAIK